MIRELICFVLVLSFGTVFAVACAIRSSVLPEALGLHEVLGLAAARIESPDDSAGSDDSDGNAVEKRIPHSRHRQVSPWDVV